MAKPVEEQVQDTLPQDNRVQILNHRIYYDRFGCSCVEGGIKNLTTDSNVTANIKVDYFDIDGQYIDSEIQVLKHRYPGRAIGFHVMYGGRRRLEVRSYKVYVNN